MFEFERTTGILGLQAAWKRISAKPKTVPGLDQVSVADYSKNVMDNLQALHYALTSESYVPYAEKQYVAKDQRSIFISCVEDKIVQTAAATVISETMQFSASVHGFIKQRSIYTAHKRLCDAIAYSVTEYYKTDIKRFYESIERRLLLQRLEKMIPDPRFLRLVQLLMKNHPMGISTGSCLSPVLSNVFLLDFDYKLDRGAGFYSRYVDDILIAPKDNRSMISVIDDMHSALRELRLEANLEKSRIVNADEGFQYLGFDIRQNQTVERLLQQRKYTEADQLLCQEEQSFSTELLPRGAYFDLFVRDTTEYYVSDSAQERYMPREGQLDATVLQALLREKKEFAVPTLNKGGLCSFAVLDIDINREIILAHGDDGKTFEQLSEQALTVAKQLVERLAAMGVKGYIEFSGYKGYHVWAFWKRPISLPMQKMFFKQVCEHMEVPAGLHIEKFPICDDDQKIKLPFSHHTISGKLAMFIEAQAEPMTYIETIERSEYLGERPAVKLKTEKAQDIPAHIQAVYSKCHIVRSIVDKAKSNQFIGYHERMALLHVFHCLGQDGADFIHSIMRQCINYSFEVTQNYIDRCNLPYPIGCKKLSDRFEDTCGKNGCTCNFTNASMYPSPVIHAVRVLPNCFSLPKQEERTGHFKQAPVKESVDDTLRRLIDLNKKEYELRQQRGICNGQIESLFSRNSLTEIQTPQGLLIKTEEGFFLKVI